MSEHFISIGEFTDFVLTGYGQKTAKAVSAKLGKASPTVEYNYAMEKLEEVLDKHRPNSFCGSTTTTGRFDTPEEKK